MSFYIDSRLNFNRGYPSFNIFLTRGFQSIRFAINEDLRMVGQLYTAIYSYAALSTPYQGQVSEAYKSAWKCHNRRGTEYITPAILINLFV